MVQKANESLYEFLSQVRRALLLPSIQEFVVFSHDSELPLARNEDFGNYDRLHNGSIPHFNFIEASEDAIYLYNWQPPLMALCYTDALTTLVFLSKYDRHYVSMYSDGDDADD